MEGEGLGRLEDGRLVRDAVGVLPILVKLLDSDERLVVQAHPTVPCAKRLFNSPVGKTECWYFLPGTAPDACVHLGFKPGITRAVWEDAVMKCSQFTNVHKSSLSTNDNCGAPGGRALPVGADLRAARDLDLTIVNNPVLNLLHRIPVAPGDFVFVDGGVPHAIGGGCFLVELQEPSDLMVVAERFTPSGRRIPDAKMHGGVGWERMFDVYEYEGRTFEETCERYVRKYSQFSNVHKSSLDINDTNVNTNVANVEVLPLPVSNFANAGQDWKLNLGTGNISTMATLPHTPASPSLSAPRICGPDFTDKFQMWRLAGGESVAHGGKSAVIVVIEGDGTLNGLSVKRGDRLVAADEGAIDASGAINAVVCTAK